MSSTVGSRITRRNKELRRNHFLPIQPILTNIHHEIPLRIGDILILENDVRSIRTSIQHGKHDISLIPRPEIRIPSHGVRSILDPRGSVGGDTEGLGCAAEGVVVGCAGRDGCVCAVDGKCACGGENEGCCAAGGDGRD